MRQLVSRGVVEDLGRTVLLGVTVAGLATGLVATGSVATSAHDGRREKVLHVGRNGDSRFDCALVDVAVTSEPWIGARAVLDFGTGLRRTVSSVRKLC